MLTRMMKKYPTLVPLLQNAGGRGREREKEREREREREKDIDMCTII